MKLALAEAERSIVSGSLPFAAVAVDERGEVVGQDHDRVEEYSDPTAHAEVNLIRKICRERQSTSLSDLTFYTTSEPCPTCLSAMIKAKVKRCVFGCDTEPTASLPIPATELAARATKYQIEITPHILEAECLKQREDYFFKSSTS